MTHLNNFFLFCKGEALWHDLFDVLVICLRWFWKGSCRCLYIILQCWFPAIISVASRMHYVCVFQMFFGCEFWMMFGEDVGSLWSRSAGFVWRRSVSAGGVAVMVTRASFRRGLRDWTICLLLSLPAVLWMMFWIKLVSIWARFLEVQVL